MSTEPRKAQQVLEFGSSHALARWALAPAAMFLLLGLGVLLVADDGAALVGWSLAGLGGMLLAVIATRLAQPPTAAIMLSPEGLLFRDVSSQVIPWREIRAVDIGEVREISAIVPRRVVSIAVSRAFFATLSSKSAWPGEVVSIGEPTLIHLAYYRRDVPVDELAAIIKARRRSPGA